MKVSVVGTGYVGLVTGVCFAEMGHQVNCVDIDQEKVIKINQGISPIYEKGLHALLKKNIGANLRATTNLGESVMTSDISFIAVGTPFDDTEIDLTYVKEVAYQIGKSLQKKSSYHLVVMKSTVVPGTTDEVVLPILENASGKKAGVDFGVGMNPEFLREGEAVQDFMLPDRIVMGGMDDRTISVLDEMYSVFDGIDKLKTNNKTAEMIKYTSNSLLATMISFSNEIGNLCASIGGIDVVEVMKGVHMDKRLSPIMSNGARIVPSFTTYLEAGCGFGGSCLPKDVQALIAHGEKCNNPMHLLNAVIKINEQQPQKILHILKKHFSSLEGIPIAVLGLAFKPETDDMRESPAIPVINDLIDLGAKIRAYDPVAKEEAMKIFTGNNIVYCDEISDTINDAEVIIILTRWDVFNNIPEIISQYNKKPLVIDGRRMLNKEHIEKYEGIGWNKKLDR